MFWWRIRLVSAKCRNVHFIRAMPDRNQLLGPMAFPAWERGCGTDWASVRIFPPAGVARSFTQQVRAIVDPPPVRVRHSSCKVDKGLWWWGGKQIFGRNAGALNRATAQTASLSKPLPAAIDGVGTLCVIIPSSCPASWEYCCYSVVAVSGVWWTSHHGAWCGESRRAWRRRWSWTPRRPC